MLLTKELPVVASPQVLVCGAGCAGTIAALAAARRGASVMLIERFGFAGGYITGVVGASFDGFVDLRSGYPVVGGIVAEFAREASGKTDAMAFSYSPSNELREMRETPNRKSIRFSIEGFKRTADDAFAAAGIQVLDYTQVVDVLREGDRVAGVVVANKAGLGVIRAETVVDATGDGDVAGFAGAPFELSDDMQPMSLHFRIVNVRVGAHTRDACSAALKEAQARGELGLYGGPWIGRLQPETEVYVNACRCVGSGIDPADLTRAEIQGRRDALVMFNAFKKVPGFEDAYLSSTGPFAGVREFAAHRGRQHADRARHPQCGRQARRGRARRVVARPPSQAGVRLSFARDGAALRHRLRHAAAAGSVQCLGGRPLPFRRRRRAGFQPGHRHRHGHGRGGGRGRRDGQRAEKGLAWPERASAAAGSAEGRRHHPRARRQDPRHRRRHARRSQICYSLIANRKGQAMAGTDRLRVGMLGVGVAGNYHALYAQYPRSRLDIVFDTRPDVAKVVAAEHGAALAPSEEALIAADIDAVVITTPNAVHLRQAVAALRAGKHVLLQKPMTLDPAEAAELTAVAARSGRRLAMYMNSLDNPVMQDLRRMVREGTLGRIGGINAKLANGGAWRWRGQQQLADFWRGSRAAVGGGSFAMLATHYINLCQWLLDEPIVAIAARGRNLMSEHIEGDDIMAAIAEFRSGVLGVIEFGVVCEGRAVLHPRQRRFARLHRQFRGHAAGRQAVQRRGDRLHDARPACGLRRPPGAENGCLGKPAQPAPPVHRRDPRRHPADGAGGARPAGHARAGSGLSRVGQPAIRNHRGGVVT